MDVAKWNSVLDRMLELQSVVPLGTRARIALTSDDADQAAPVVSDKAFNRMKMGSEIPRSVQRFFSLTQPHKMWGESFSTQFNAYDEVWAMRKHDGWFIGVYVNDQGEVKWHTMGGNVFSFIQESMDGFLKKLQDMVQNDIIQARFAFKMEFTIRETLGDRMYRELRNEMKRDGARYVGVIVDYFTDYNKEMDKEVLRLSQGGKAIDGPSWRKGWYESGMTIKKRLDDAKAILGAAVDGMAHKDDKFEVWVANVEQAPYERRNAYKVVPYFAGKICESYSEGYVLHCYTSSASGGEAAKYDIFKLKLEQLGDCGVYYGESEKSLKVKLKPEEMHAGRQFLVRCLGAECYALSNLPHHLLIGYFDEEADKYMVTDRLKLRGVSDSVERAGANSRYFHATRNLGKHPNLTVTSRSMANIIACIADSMDARSLLDRENLKFSSMIPGDAKSSMINLSKAGILIAGGANLVWKSNNGTLHMDAAVVKRMAIVEGKGQPKINSLRGTATDEFVLKLEKDVVEWDKARWDEMTDLMKFNKSRVLFDQGFIALSDILEEQERVYKKPKVQRSIENSYKGLNVWIFGCFIFNYGGPQQSIPHGRLKAMQAQGVNLMNVKTNDKGLLVYEMKMPSKHDKVDIIMVNASYCSTWRLGRKQFTDKAFYDDLKSSLQDECIILSDKYASEMASGAWKDPRHFVVKYNGSDQKTTGISDFLRERRSKRAADSSEGGPAARGPRRERRAAAAPVPNVVSKSDIETKLKDLDNTLNSDPLNGINVYIHSSASPGNDEKDIIDYMKESIGNYGMNLVQDIKDALVIVTGNVKGFDGAVFLHPLFFYEYNLLRFCEKSDIPAGFTGKFTHEADKWNVGQYVFEGGSGKFSCSSTSYEIDGDDALECYETNNEVVTGAQCFHAALNDFCASRDGYEDDVVVENDEDEDCVMVEPPAAQRRVEAHPLRILNGKKFYVQRFSGRERYAKLEENVKNLILTHGGTMLEEPVEMNKDAIESENWDSLQEFNVCIGFDRINCVVWNGILHPQYFFSLDNMVRARDIDPSFLATPDMRFFVFLRGVRKQFTTSLPNGRKNLNNSSDFDMWMSGGLCLRDEKRAHEILRQPFVSQTELKSKTYVWAMEPDGTDRDAMQQCVDYLRTQKCTLICTDTPHSDSFFPVLFYKWPPPSAFQKTELILVHHQYIIKLRDSQLPDLTNVGCHPQDIYSFQWRQHFNWWSMTTSKITVLLMDRPFWRNLINHNIFIQHDERLQQFFDAPHLHKKDRQHNAKRRQQMMYLPMLRLVPRDDEADISDPEGAGGDASGRAAP